MTAWLAPMLAFLLGAMASSASQALTCVHLEQHIYLRCPGGDQRCEAVFQSIQVGQRDCSRYNVVRPVPLELAALAERLVEARRPPPRAGLYALVVAEPERLGFLKPDLQDFARRLDVAAGGPDPGASRPRSIDMPPAQIVAAMQAYGDSSWWRRVGPDGSVEAAKAFELGVKDEGLRHARWSRIVGVLEWMAIAFGVAVLLHATTHFFERLHSGAPPRQWVAVLGVQVGLAGMAVALYEFMSWWDMAMVVYLACLIGLLEAWAGLRHWHRFRAGRS